MEDIKKFLTFFEVINGVNNFIWCIMLIFSVWYSLSALCFGGHGDIFFLGVLIALAVAALWYVSKFMIKLQEILVTRFVAMTENVLEITQMLEKKFEENN